MAKIQISQIDFPAPDFKFSLQSKEKVILKWLIDWLDYAIGANIIQYGDFLPEKFKLAKYLNVSTGTLQNAIRQAEDMGYFESRQSVGTVIKNPNSKDNIFEKTGSKKDKAVLLIKKYILDTNLKLGQALPNVKEFSRMIGLGDSTIRLALETLVAQGVLKVVPLKVNKSKWVYNSLICPDGIQFKGVNLVSSIAKKIKNYISQNCNVGDKIPSNSFFSKEFNISIRTVNEATRILNEQKVILSRRGRYGTIYLNTPEKIKMQKNREEKSLFMSKGKTQPLQENYLYCWEKTLDALKKYIIQNHQSGEKIPPMRELASILNVSTNTIKRAVSILCEEGYLIAQRGKYGGVFILEIPQEERNSEAFTWLALNPDVVKIKQN